MSKEAEIIKILADATTTGKQKWEHTAILDEFIAAFGDGFTLAIKPEPDPRSDEPDYVVDFRNQDGLVVATVVNTIEEVDYRQLKALYTAARRSALKIDETLDAMLKSLKPQ